MAKKTPESIIVCTPKHLPQDQWQESAKNAVAINPANHPRLEALTAVMPEFHADAMRIAVVTTKFWHTDGVHLTVGFLDAPPAALRKHILSHMNAWNKTAKVKFVETKTDPQVRIARTAGDGYWSYVGVDILSIDPDQPTMNLDSFTMQTPESEFHRVVRHETGHTLGCPHEHMRKAIVDRIDPVKATKYFKATQGWSAAETKQQVLTPIEESSLIGTGLTDENSIMCYQLPGTIMKDGKPVPGGLDIDALDYQFMGNLYKKKK